MTKIEWVARPGGTVPESWNPVSGCTKISAGCKHCYAERMARRLAGRYGYPKAPHHFDVTLHADKLELPLRWRKPRTVFVNSMSDLFHEDVPWAFRSDIFSVMAMCQQHTFLVLTKRAREMFDWFIHPVVKNRQYPMEGSLAAMRAGKTFTLPLPNVWFGVTIENPDYCWRAHFLRETPAVTRFISFEPLLGSFADYPGALDDIDWAIVGGESGPGARPMHPDWVRGLRDWCRMEGIAFFFKQWGRFAPALTTLRKPGLFFYADGHVADEWDGGKYSNSTGAGMCYMAPFGKKEAGRVLDGRTWDEFPEGREKRKGG